MILVYDTETQGLPKFGEPSNSPDQPHLVEIGAILVDDSWNVVDTYHAVIRPMGWHIPANVSGIHGITHAFAEEHGIDEAQALNGLLELMARSRLRVAYNEPFDARIIRIALHRYAPEKLAWWEGLNAQCAMRHTQALIGGRVPTLYEAHEAVVGRPLRRGS